jgi:ubiquinone/menaquinone biosynthesis C-methylase UbiE
VPSIDWNRHEWDRRHDWDREGDEWSGMAAHCGQPYDEWKAALVESFLAPLFDRDLCALEIAPGHGRWASVIAPRVADLTLVDLSPTCIEHCRDRLGAYSHIHFIVNDGASLPGVDDRSIDFVWSFDSFVHMEMPVIDGYLAEIARVLKPGGRAILHHADKRAWPLAMTPVTERIGRPGKVLLQLAAQGRLRDGGNRGNVTAAMVAAAARKHALRVDRQVDRWGDRGQYTVTKYRDIISELHAPLAPA